MVCGRKASSLNNFCCKCKFRRRTLAEQFPKNMLFPKDTTPQETSNHTLLNGCHLAHQKCGCTRMIYTGKQRVRSNKGNLFQLKHNQSQMTSSDEWTANNNAIKFVSKRRPSFGYIWSVGCKKGKQLDSCHNVYITLRRSTRTHYTWSCNTKTRPLLSC